MAARVTGHLKLEERRDGPVWYAKTRVPTNDDHDVLMAQLEAAIKRSKKART